MPCRFPRSSLRFRPLGLRFRSLPSTRFPCHEEGLIPFFPASPWKGEGSNLSFNEGLKPTSVVVDHPLALSIHLRPDPSHKPHDAYCLLFVTHIPRRCNLSCSIMIRLFSSTCSTLLPR